MYGLFLGIHCADGTIPKYRGKNQYLWEFSERDKEAADFVVDLVRKEFASFNLNVHMKQRGNQYVVFIKNKKFWTFLTDKLGLPIGKKSEIIDMPKCVTKREYKDFINGVISSDGFVFADRYNIPRIRLNIHSKKLRNTISNLLKELKIKHTIGERVETSKPPNSEKVYTATRFRLDVYGKNAIDYFNKVGIWHPIKRQRFLILLNSVKSRETGAPR